MQVIGNEAKDNENAYQNQYALQQRYHVQNTSTEKLPRGYRRSASANICAGLDVDSCLGYKCTENYTANTDCRL